MPVDLGPWEFEPFESKRKKYIEQGGLGGSELNGHKNPREHRRYVCCNCKQEYKWTSDLQFTDFDGVVDNICGPCRKIQRTMMTNHPEWK